MKMYNYHGDLLMTNYVEYVFLENLVINYIIIYQVSIFTKIKIKKINTLLGNIILSFYTILNYFLSTKIITITLIKVFVVSFSIYVIYIPKGLKKYFKLCAYYFLTSFLLVGVVISITLLFDLDISNVITKIILYIISGILLYLINKFMWKMWKSKIKKDDLIYKLKIKDIEINSFIDTGNNVYDYVNNLDVIFIENDYLKIFFENNLLNKNVNLNINTITGNETCRGYVVNNIKVIKNKKKICELKKVVFVFVNKNFNNNDYKALIGYNTYIDKLKGVSLC